MTRTSSMGGVAGAEAGTARTLVLFDGDLPSVLAVAYAAEEALLPARRSSSRVIRTHAGPDRRQPSDGGPAPAPMVCPAYFGLAEARERAAALGRVLDLFSLDRVADDTPPLSTRPDAAGEDQTRLLVHAGYLALSVGCDRVVWPAQCGEDLRTEAPTLERIAGAIDRALLVSRVIALDTPRAVDAPEIETPFVDLSDRQIAEMVMDIEAPLSGCWWWGGSSPSALAARDRWGTLLRSLGWGGALGPG